METFFDNLARTTADAFILRLVAGFERRASEHLSNAVGAARGAVKSAVRESEPFGRAAQKLVRRAKDFKLQDLQGLAESYPAADIPSFTALREHRNHVAHGGRIGKISTYSDPREVHRALADLLSILEGAPE